MKRSHSISTIVLLVFAVTLSACTEKKAQALQLAAQNFSSEARDAVQTVRELFTADFSGTAETLEEQTTKVVANIEALKPSEQLKAELLSELIKGPTLANPARELINDEFNLLDRAYSGFASMYESLPRGYLFSRDAVKRSEKQAIKLTIQLINVADHVKKYPFKFHGRRVLLIEKIEQARKIGDKDSRKAIIRLLAEEVVRLRHDEMRANNEAILKCLRGAESGKRVSELIRDYEQLSLEDILAETGSALGFVSAISGGNADVEALVKKYNNIRDTIKSDPYWAPLLDQRIAKGGGNG